MTAATPATYRLSSGHALYHGRGMDWIWSRSEEHTSELQSHSDLVCRLLLEKKKKKKEVGLVDRNRRNLSIARTQAQHDKHSTARRRDRRRQLLRHAAHAVHRCTQGRSVRTI